MGQFNTPGPIHPHGDRDSGVVAGCARASSGDNAVTISDGEQPAGGVNWGDIVGNDRALASCLPSGSPNTGTRHRQRRK